jgi:EAL domain-containing protein (putative c-di-GMP-specific phosphodiesterase class I)
MLIDTFLEPGQLLPVFQPIVDVASGEARVHGLECLTRGAPGTRFESAEVMFEYVRYKAAEPRIDRACIAAAFGAARVFPPGVRLSANVHAATLARDPSFPHALEAMVASCGVDPRRLTLEITEHSAPWMTPTFFRTLAHVRQQGVAIALDDVGLGHSNFKMMVDVRPEVLKVDRYFVHGARHDDFRRAIIDAVVHLAERVGAQVVAEGVGDEDDLEAVRASGVTLIQGFYFARPAPAESLLLHALFAPRTQPPTSP